MKPTPITRSILRAASVRSALSRSAPSVGSMYWVSTPSSAWARVRPRHAASLNDLSFLPPTSNTRPTRIPEPAACPVARNATAPPASSTALIASNRPIKRRAVTAATVAENLRDCADLGGFVRGTLGKRRECLRCVLSRKRGASTRLLRRQRTMGIMSFIKGGVAELAIARPDSAKDQWVYKHPDQTIPMKAQLTVDSDEVALFFKDGKF